MTNATGLTTRPCFPAPAAAHTFEITEREFLLDGETFVMRCGELHFARIPPEYWRHRLQMAKAMGLNTVCAYLFWNFHEWEEGRFEWAGWGDVVEFCRLAQEEGLWVLVRPGPYSCAEWEMGGLPWWLVKNDGIQLRSSDPLFLEPAVRYFKEVGRVLGPQQITRGGPVLMFQVENEYGSFGRDAEYMGALRQALIDGGIDVPLFACNPPGVLQNGLREDLFQVVNFSPGGSVDAFKKLRSIQKTGPLMNGEYYPAWFDMWGVPHHTTKIANFIGDLAEMLRNQNSFSIYMVHGGTSFGFWAGADRPFRPDTTSYDYDAPISEAGWATQNFHEIRALFSQHLLPGETLPEVPEANPVIEIPSFRLEETAPVFANLPTPIHESGAPKTMEFYGQSRGCILYRTILPPGPAGILTPRAVHDFAWVYLDGNQIGVMDRRARRFSVTIPARDKEMRLDILIETMGRVNFGQEIFDRKGLHAPVEYSSSTGKNELLGWEIYPLPLANDFSNLKFSASSTQEPSFWRGSFELAKAGDTFLDLTNWGKGVLWINGHCLGRFWNIGPAQTLYCPAPWLRMGSNEVVVLDLLGPDKPEITGLPSPILDSLRLDRDFYRSKRASGSFSAEGMPPAAAGTFTAEIDWQEVRFAKPVSGRYLCLEAVSSCDGGHSASIAELDACDSSGKVLSKTSWSIHWASSEETSAVFAAAENVLDGQPATFWLSKRNGNEMHGYPHQIIIDLGEATEVGGIRYLARAGNALDSGKIADFRVYIAETPFGLTGSVE